LACAGGTAAPVTATAVSAASVNLQEDKVR
jgi:hypothetical protein